MVILVSLGTRSERTGEIGRLIRCMGVVAAEVDV